MAKEPFKATPERLRESHGDEESSPTTTPFTQVQEIHREAMHATKLERIHYLPETRVQAHVADLESRVAVIVCHPWSVLGGNMHNNVVVATVLYFQNLRITTVRFDFVGTQIGRGYREVRQVQETAQYLLDGKHMDDDSSEQPPSYILLVGYSYGSLITASASSTIPACVGYISIAPPISVQHWLLCFNARYHANQARRRTELPRLLILGSRDNFTSEDLFSKTVASYPNPSTTGAILKDADHFFFRREKDLMAVVGQWLQTAYSACGGDLYNLCRLELQAFMKHSNSNQEGTEHPPTYSSSYCAGTCTG